MTITLAALRREIARQSGQGVAGTCSANGTTTTLIDDALSDVFSQTTALNRAWLYRPPAAAADQLRQVAVDGFAANGTLTPSRAWAVAPVSGEAYEIYPLLPPFDHPAIPYSWLRAVNDGLAMCYFRDDIVLGRGDDQRRRRYYFRPTQVTLYALVTAEGGTDITITPPSGWTLVTRIDDTTTLSLALYARRADLTDPLTWTWTLTSCVAGGCIFAVIDAETASPVEASAGQANVSAVTAEAPDVSSATGDTLVTRVFATALTGAMGAPEGQRRRYDLGEDKPLSGVGLLVTDADLASAGAAGAVSADVGTATRSIGLSFVTGAKDEDSRVAFVAAAGGHNGTGGGTTLVLPRPSTAANDDWTPNAETVEQIYSRHYTGQDFTDVDESRNGRSWRWLDDPPGVELLYAPGVDVDVFAKVARPYPALAADGDETECPTVLAVAAARYAAYRYLNGASTSEGAYQRELASAMRAFNAALRTYGLSPVIVGI